MKKNYFDFKKAMTAVMMLLSVSFGVQSCGLFDDVPDTPTQDNKPSTPEDDATSTPNSTEATVDDLAGITDLLDQVKSDIEESAKSGEEYEITIKNDNLETTTSDNTIEVPRVEGSNINLNFTNGVSTEQTLVVKAADTESSTPTESVNELTITMPAETKDLNLELDMPETTVTLKAASGTVVYDEVIATTALNTLYIEKGVTVKNLQVKGGTVVVKDGGTAETYVYASASTDDLLYICDNRVELGTTDRTQPSIVVVKDANGAPYPFKYFKVIKGVADYANIDLETYNYNSYSSRKLTIAEGVIVKMPSYTNEPCMGIIEGEGKGAELVTGYFYRIGTDENGKRFPRLDCHLNFNEVKNIILSEAQPEGLADSLVFLADNIPSNLENCTLKFDDIQFRASETSTGSVKSCKFEATNKNNIIHVSTPAQSDAIPSYKFNFTDCNFSQGLKLETTLPDLDYVYDENGEKVADTYWYYYDNEGTYHGDIEDASEIPDDAEKYGSYERYRTTDAKFEDYYVTIAFTNCKIGSNSLTSSSDFLAKFDIPTGVYLRFEIDGNTYEPVWNADAQKYTLELAQ